MRGEEKLTAYAFTFGLSHPLSDMVQIVMASNENAARVVMHQFYGDKWCGCYAVRTFKRGEPVEVGGCFYTPIEKVLREGDFLG